MKSLMLQPYRPEVASALRVDALTSLYLADSMARSVHSPEALADRRYVLGLFDAAYGELRISDLRAYHLTDFIAAHPTWKSPATRRAKANAVKACFEWAFKQERIDRNPFRSVHYEDAERRAEMPDKLLEVLKAKSNKPFEQAMYWLRLTACRLNELCEARWADVDLERGTWVIHYHKERRYTGRHKMVALVPDAVSLLRVLALSRTGEVIFLNNRGTPWTRRTLGQQLGRMKKRHGIKTPATLHGLRHRAATAMIAAGAPIKLVAEQLGHSTTAITEAFYWHASVDHIEALRRAAQLGVERNP